MVESRGFIVGRLESNPLVNFVAVHFNLYAFSTANAVKHAADVGQRHPNYTIHGLYAFLKVGRADYRCAYRVGHSYPSVEITSLERRVAQSSVNLDRCSRKNDQAYLCCSGEFTQTDRETR